MKPKPIVLDGKSLKIDDLKALVCNPEIQINIDSQALKQARKARSFLENTVKKNNKIIYGVNTGFGPMASHILAKPQLTALQHNLINSHAVGMGKPVETAYVLSAMVVRLNTLAKGHSGVSEQLLLQLQKFINYRIIPVVPEHGAVGTSGDLVQLAQIALVLLGKGQAFYEDKIFPAEQLLKKFKLKPYELKIKEGLSLINGTSMMSGIAALVCHDADKLVKLATATGALAMELVRSHSDSISPELQSLRPHQGQQQIAANLRKILASSKLLRDRKKEHIDLHIPKGVLEISDRVQEVYSIRCVPQILGPIWESLQRAKKITEIETNSVTDNPIVYWESKQFLHGGNFHGDYIATAVDQLKMSLVKLSLLSERRVNFFLHSKINHSFPPFLNLNTPGLTLGLQGLQFVATSTASQNQTLAFPQSVHSIPTNADNQDVVSMGTDAALMAVKVIENCFIITTIELITLIQAMDHFKHLTSFCRLSQELYGEIRQLMPSVEDDDDLNPYLQKVLDYTKNKILPIG